MGGSAFQAGASPRRLPHPRTIVCTVLVRFVVREIIPLYRKGRYAESFPYLQAAARTGFKLAQARLGYLYQHGLGTDRDPYAAIGWYGVAATGTTLPEIRNGFKKIWRGIPEEYRPAVSTLVDEYRQGSAHDGIAWSAT